jgi:hypothetical protein
MTGYTVHTGSNDKFSNGWDQIFANKKTVKKGAPAAEKKSAVAAPAPKRATKKKA